MKQEGILFPRHTYAKWMIDSSDQYLEKVYRYMPVSYTHLDVYKRQALNHMNLINNCLNIQLRNLLSTWEV